MDNKRGARKKEYNKESSRYPGKVNEDETSGPNREEADKRKVELKCKQCRRKVQRDEKSFECFRCGLWFHLVCENIEEDLYKQLKGIDNFSWYCKRCNPKLGGKDPKNFMAELVENKKKLKEDNTRMKKELEGVNEGNERAREALRRLEKLKEKVFLQGNINVCDEVESKIVTDLSNIKLELEDVQKKIKTLNKKWEREEEMDEIVLETNVPETNAPETNAPETDVPETNVPETKKVSGMLLPEINEREERDKRNNNLVIHNIDEPKDMKGKKLYDHDLAVCIDIFVNEIGELLDEGEIAGIARLGKKGGKGESQNQRPRCLLVKMKNPEMKWRILKSAKNLKTTRKNEYKRVFIQPDLTKREREKDRESREKLREKKELGEEGWYIKRGHLERRN
ncbi:hypothetical protein Pmani_015302 [Petrolisthes manimaculis]|uniref:PHD-type domain-containing protein n=1 Tax=Petrolisthes manimaculis TaxID=1843537 RepID=A0AAE1PRW3_9EUCA|nr:hypothetical protein Pmani_015302 [Petrolisthes manimaculis]